MTYKERPGASSAYFLLFGLLIMVGCAATLLKWDGKERNETLVLSLLAIIGVLGIVFALGLIAYIFAAMGLSDEKQALGLPEGTIRAVTALILLVLFASVPLFLYGSLNHSAKRQEHLTAGSKDALVALLPPGEPLVFIDTPAKPEVKDPAGVVVTPAVPALYTVIYSGVTATQANFATQLVTSIVTLVTTVVGFYFGAGVATGGAKPGAKGKPALTAVNPKSAPVGFDGEVEVTGTNLELVGEFKLIQGNQQVSGKAVTSSPFTAKARFTIADPLIPGKCTVEVTTSDGQSARLPDAFVIT